MSTLFTCVVNPDTSDTELECKYLKTWEDEVECSLTSAATKVFGHGGVTGSIEHNDAVTGNDSGATATVAKSTTGQILLFSISGTFQSGEKVYVTAGGGSTDYIFISEKSQL